MEALAHPYLYIFTGASQWLHTNLLVGKVSEGEQSKAKAMIYYYLPYVIRTNVLIVKAALHYNEVHVR